MWYKLKFKLLNFTIKILLLSLGIYLNPIAACQTKANNKKKTGIMGKTSTIGLNAIYASGKRDKSKLSIIKTFVEIKN